MLLQRSPSTRKVETGVPWEGAEVLVKTEPDKFKIQVQVDHHENCTMLNAHLLLFKILKLITRAAELHLSESIGITHTT